MNYEGFELEKLRTYTWRPFYVGSRLNNLTQLMVQVTPPLTS